MKLEVADVALICKMGSCLDELRGKELSHDEQRLIELFDKFLKGTPHIETTDEVDLVHLVEKLTPRYNKFLQKRSDITSLFDFFIAKCCFKNNVDTINAVFVDEQAEKIKDIAKEKLQRVSYSEQVCIEIEGVSRAVVEKLMTDWTRDGLVVSEEQEGYFQSAKVARISLTTPKNHPDRLRALQEDLRAVNKIIGEKLARLHYLQPVTIESAFLSEELAALVKEFWSDANFHVCDLVVEQGGDSVDMRPCLCIRPKIFFENG